MIRPATPPARRAAHRFARLTARAVARLTCLGVLAALAWAGGTFPGRAPARAEDAPAGELKPFSQRLLQSDSTIDMLPVKGGTVEMELTDASGNKVKQSVTIKDFYLAKTEITWDQYDQWSLMGDLPEDQKNKGTETNLRPSKPYGTPDHGFGHKDYPVLHVAYQSAKEFCNWLSAKSGKKYRLPTEAEWQYAATAGGKEPAQPTPLTDYAWIKDNSDEKTHQCATKKPNGLGLCDMFGNVGEWVVPSDGEKKGADGKPQGVVKGGSYLDEKDDVSATARVSYKEEWQTDDPQDPKSHWWLSNGGHIGFRIVCEP